jgi:hypothetical protein
MAPGTPAGEAAGTCPTLQGARQAILTRDPPFLPSNVRLDTEKAGRVIESGKLVPRTLSYFLVPVMSLAILGIDDSMRFFPELSMADFGAGFLMTDAVDAVHTILRSGAGEAAIKPEDIQSNPRGNGKLYFSERLQTAVLNEIETKFSQLHESIKEWINRRFLAELQAITQENRNAPATTSPSPAAAPGAHSTSGESEKGLGLISNRQRAKQGTFCGTLSFCT